MSKKSRLLVLFSLLIALILLVLWLRQDEVTGSIEGVSRSLIVAAPALPEDPERAKIDVATQETAATKNDNVDDAAELAASLVPKNMLFWENSFSLSIAVQNALKLSPNDALLIEGIIKEASYALATDLAKNAKLVKRPEGDVYFAISKLDSLNNFKEELASKIESAVGGSRGKMIAALAADTSMFSQFGEKDLEIYVSDETNPDGIKQTYVKTEIGGAASDRVTFYTLISEQMKHPIYELLTQKFKNEIN